MIDNDSLTAPVADNDAPMPSDSFSWHRICELAAFYRPIIQKPLLWYALVSLLYSILLALPFIPTLHDVLWISMGGAVIPFMLYFGPLMFTRGGDCRVVERLIPALPVEKLLFYLAVCLLIIPVATNLLPNLVIILEYGDNPFMNGADKDTFDVLRRENPSLVVFGTIANFIQPAAFILTCLYCVIACKSNRIIKGIASIFALMFIITVGSVIWGIWLALSNQLQALPDPDIERASWIFSHLTELIILISAAGIVYSAVIIALIYKNLKRIP